MGIQMKKTFNPAVVASLERMDRGELSKSSLEFADTQSLCQFYEICLVHDLDASLTEAIEREFLSRNLPEYIVPRMLFTQLNASMLSLPFAKVVWETKPLGCHLFFQDCLDRYYPPSFGWYIGYILALGFGKVEVAEKIANQIRQYEPVALCMPHFLSLVVSRSDISERIVDLQQKMAHKHTLKEGTEVSEEIEVQEDIEKHNELNKVLFKDNKLKPEVREKALEVADELLSMLADTGLNIKLADLVLTGSNASYTYTKDSDIDLHLVADMTDIEDPEGLYPILFNIFKSAFNNKYDISFYGIPVELYIEVENTASVSNGIYSIQKDEWIKEPVPAVIPEIDLSQLEKELQPWIARYDKLLQDVKSNKITTEAPITQFIDDLYKARERGLHGPGGSEYSSENLVFKELRNLGYLENLKDLRDTLISKRLSLEEWLEAFKALSSRRAQRSPQ